MADYFLVAILNFLLDFLYGVVTHRWDVQNSRNFVLSKKKNQAKFKMAETSEKKIIGKISSLFRNWLVVNCPPPPDKTTKTSLFLITLLFSDLRIFSVSLFLFSLSVISLRPFRMFVLRYACVFTIRYEPLTCPDTTASLYRGVTRSCLLHIQPPMVLI